MPVAVLGVMGWSRRWVTDDAFITLRSVENLLAGHGPVFNVGERIEASTSTVWHYLLAAVGVTRSIVPLEWWAVVLGLLASIGALVLAQIGSLTLLRTERDRIAVPLGALVVAALPPFWDFATSGLETGITYLWLAACFFALARAVRARPERVPWWVAVVIGLGPLVRPDLGVYTLGFAAVMLVAERPLRARRLLSLAVTVAAVPVAYQLFRMAYYAALVPTPAIAKSAGASYWSQGWRYLVDANRPYALWLPVVAVLLATALAYWGRSLDAGALVTAVVLCAALHAAFVVRVGGDFMHARLLLPSVFATCLPVAAVPVTRALVAPAAAVAIWAVVCGITLRPSAGLSDHGIANERSFYSGLSGAEHPVTVDDYRRWEFARQAEYDRAATRSSARAFVLPDTADPPASEEYPLATGLPERRVVRLGVIGVYGFAAGSGVSVVEGYGLVDPISARLRVEARGRPGHEKVQPHSWLLARWVDPAAPAGAGAPRHEVESARRALACPPLRDLLDSIRKPLTPSLALENMWRSVGYTRLEIPPDPAEAATELC